ncbi:hypothetical protein RI129_008151 [Pyrocoelia pectoralis]|uniref:Major facilitator superfamily (MFS) profile domain-containing protein n=1 Tax=Pyrocoelia pectoralis TaxID=417401 RepID=A0AAN7VDL5_9COLE
MLINFFRFVVKMFDNFTILAVPCLGSVCTGAVEGWTGNISEDMKKLTFNGIPITEENLGFIGSLSTLGCVFACIPSAYLSNWVGRKVAIMLLIIPLVLGWLLIIFAQELWMLALGRFLCGLTDGAFFALLPMYVSEIAEKDIRGCLTGYFDLFLTVGILSAFTVSNFLNMHQYTIVMGCFPLIFAFLFSFQPETPVFLVMKRREKEAYRSLRLLRKGSRDVANEMEGIKLIISQDYNKKYSLLKEIQEKSVRKAILICFPLMFLQQAGGINTVTYYTSSIFAATEVGLNEKVSTLIIGIVSVFSTFLTTLLVDKLGRRVLLIASNLGSSIAVGTLALFFTLQTKQLVEESIIDTLRFLPLISVSLFSLAFSLGNGTIPWLLISELFPPEIKSLAAGCGATINLITGFLLCRYYFNLTNAIGSAITFYIFSTMNLVTAIFVYYAVPETRGKSFAELQTQLKNDH